MLHVKMLALKKCTEMIAYESILTQKLSLKILHYKFPRLWYISYLDCGQLEKA